MRLLVSLQLFAFLFALNRAADEAPPQLTGSTLKLLVIAHRHGDRTPIRAYPKDPYGNASFWPDGWGELTTIGKERLYKLGKYIRKRYSAFLTDNPREVYIRSSAAERCLASVAVLLAGAYPPSGRWVWDNQIPWQPFPIQTEPRKVDGMLNPSSRCPAAEEELTRIRHSPEVKAFTNQYKDLMAHLTLNTGANITDIMQAENVYDTLFIESANSFNLPHWVNDEIMGHLKTITDYTFFIDYSTRLMQRLRTGLFFKDLQRRILYAVDKKNVNEAIEATEFADLKKLYIYSTHDSQIAAILSAMGNFNKIAPPYASTIFFELHQVEETEHMLKIFYLNDTYSEQPFELTVPGCENTETTYCLHPPCQPTTPPPSLQCHVGKFFHAIEDLIPDDWRRECRLDTEERGPFGSVLSFFALGSLLALLVTGFFLFLCVTFKRLFSCVPMDKDRLDISDEEDDEELGGFPRGGSKMKCPLTEVIEERSST